MRALALRILHFLLLLSFPRRFRRRANTFPPLRRRCRRRRRQQWRRRRRRRRRPPNAYNALIDRCLSRRGLQRTVSQRAYMCEAHTSLRCCEGALSAPADALILFFIVISEHDATMKRYERPRRERKKERRRGRKVELVHNRISKE